jgi:hypothetical protein
VPELKLGVVVLTNQESDAAFSAITWHVVLHYSTRRRLKAVSPETDFSLDFHDLLLKPLR